MKLIDLQLFEAYEDLDVLDESFLESFTIQVVGLKGNTFFVKIRGRLYGYKAKGIAMKDLIKEFKKRLQYSHGKALAYLKKNTELVSGSVKKQLEQKLQEIANFPRFFTDMITKRGGIIKPSEDSQVVSVAFPNAEKLMLFYNDYRKQMSHSKISADSENLILKIPRTDLQEETAFSVMKKIVEAKKKQKYRVKFGRYNGYVGRIVGDDPFSNKKKLEILKDGKVVGTDVQFLRNLEPIHESASIGKTDKHNIVDPEKSRKAKAAANDAETRKKKKDAQDEYELSADAKLKHKAIGRANSRRNTINKMRTTEELIESVKSGQSAMDVLNEELTPQVNYEADEHGFTGDIQAIGADEDHIESALAKHYGRGEFKLGEDGSKQKKTAGYVKMRGGKFWVGVNNMNDHKVREFTKVFDQMPFKVKLEKCGGQSESREEPLYRNQKDGKREPLEDNPPDKPQFKNRRKSNTPPSDLEEGISSIRDWEAYLKKRKYQFHSANQSKEGYYATVYGKLPNVSHFTQIKKGVDADTGKLEWTVRLSKKDSDNPKIVEGRVKELTMEIDKWIMHGTSATKSARKTKKDLEKIAKSVSDKLNITEKDAFSFVDARYKELKK